MAAWQAAAPVALYPTAAPPAPQNETVAPKPGHLWVKGRWDWKNGAWAWMPGHWERERAQLAWQDGRWERRTASGFGSKARGPRQRRRCRRGYPTAAPPAPQNENVVAEGGLHVGEGPLGLEVRQVGLDARPLGARARAMRWQDGRWESQNGKWIVGRRLVGRVRAGVPPHASAAAASRASPAAGRDATAGSDDGTACTACGTVPGAGAAMSGSVATTSDWSTKYQWVPGHWERAQRTTWSTVAGNSACKATWLPGVGRGRPGASPLATPLDASSS